MPNSPVQQDSSASSTNDNATASLISAANNMIQVTQGLISNTPCDLHIAKSITKSLNLMLSQIDALMHSAMVAGNGPPLSEKEKISPNQLLWPKTAAQMGVQHSKKHQGGKVDSVLTAKHIGESNCKRTADNDPYGAGEQSGKRAKPDARSATANTQVRTAEMRKAEPLPTQPPPMLPLTHPPPMLLPLPTSLPLPMSLPLPTSLPLSAPPPHISFPYPYNPYHFPPPPPSAPLSQPMYSHSPYYRFLTY